MKTTRLFTIITVIMIAATLTACGNAAVATTPVQEQPQVEPKQEVVAEPTAEVVEEQPEVTEEVVEPEVLTLEDWVQKVNTNNSSEDIVFTVYNENSKSGTLLDVTQGEINELGMNVITAEYTLQEGDALVVCLPNHIPGTTEFVYSSMNGISSRGFGEKYKIFDIQSGDVKFGISYMDMDYAINLTIN